MANKPFGLAVKAFVTDPEGRWLFIKRSANSKSFAGQWDLPGGKVDPGEQFDTALVREVEEETGLNVTIEGVAGAAEYEMPKVRVVLLYMRADTPGGQVRLSGEHDDYVWAMPAEVAGMDLSDQLRSFVLPYVTSVGV